LTRVVPPTKLASPSDGRNQVENILDVVAENGVPFRVIMDSIGGKEATVSFYDRRTNSTVHGQFTGGSYYVSTLLEANSSSGLNLYSGVTDWTIDSATFRLVRDWLYHYTY
jgi:hypothetical protein